MLSFLLLFFFFSSRRRHTRSLCDWSSDVCSSDLGRNRRLRLGGGAIVAVLQSSKVAAKSHRKEYVPVPSADYIAHALVCFFLGHGCRGGTIQPGLPDRLHCDAQDAGLCQWLVGRQRNDY